ncbi:MAG TPA: TetR/AcrR family transcriptional regulator C-terminal domain-containing protein [Ramlibacter sp.]|uniref:TetR/AcrR family transcriptional regulator n=1 Tax=Ramlibacter sp. TaxID=1917967 RepID=UPI002BD19FB2|nr:TetR/AcrR family transcriptional regulator C-terminal domain-containing protein [Ramlibacter sp.]HVZ46259.1 TetR/AcrR family transcriptional regulator C-terminal domain-containing protein [Ramlibacter sp.]
MPSTAAATRRTSRRAPVPPARGNLSRERIASAALALIDEEGLEALTLRSLAARLGCEAMSLYHHVRHKGDLHDAVMDVLLAEWELPARGSGSPRALLARLCDSYRDLARRHPRAFVLLAGRRFNSPAALAVLDHVLGVFTDAGLTPRLAARGFRMIGYFLNGMGLAEVAVLAIGDDPPPRAIVDRAGPQYPAIASAAPWLGPKGLDATYKAGLRALMDAILPDAA